LTGIEQSDLVSCGSVPKLRCDDPPHNVTQPRVIAGGI